MSGLSMVRMGGRVVVSILVLSVAGLASLAAPSGTDSAASSSEPCLVDTGAGQEPLESVPALSTWAAVVMAMLMLSASSFALYGGNVARRKHAVGPPVPRKPRGRNPAAAGPVDTIVERDPSAKRREAQLRRERRRMSRTHSPTSRSKKRRVGPGCRGPLRKT